MSGMSAGSTIAPGPMMCRNGTPIIAPDYQSIRSRGVHQKDAGPPPSFICAPILFDFQSFWSV
jgi:hypothetical protein